MDSGRATTSEWLDELYIQDDLDGALPRGDVVVVAIPHTPETEGLFDASKFALMKTHALFINIGRGMTVKLADLNAALRAGEIGGAGLDVFEEEPLPADHPIWEAPNFIMTPHTAVTQIQSGLPGSGQVSSQGVCRDFWVYFQSSSGFTIGTIGGK